MPKVKDIIKIIQEFAPEENTAAGYDDNVGLILGREKNEMSKVLCCLDVTASVIDEAAAIGAGLIISHHPFIYATSLKKITDKDIIGEKILSAAENNIAVYSAHTNLDIACGGINDYVAERIGLKNFSVLEKTPRGNGLGRIGDFAESLSLKALAQKAAEVFEDPVVRIISRRERAVKRVAIINGGGGGNIEYIRFAAEMGADCMITADVKYHVALFAAELGMSVIEPTHYSMEKIFIKRLAEILNSKAAVHNLKVEFISSKTENSPYICLK